MSNFFEGLNELIWVELGINPLPKTINQPNVLQTVQDFFGGKSFM